MEARGGAAQDNNLLKRWGIIKFFTLPIGRESLEWVAVSLRSRDSGPIPLGQHD
jgi:hypothetical protein